MNRRVGASGRRHHLHRRRLRGHGYFKRLGPGLVTGAADDDPSGIGTYSQVGAAYGYLLLWSLPLVGLMAAAVQESAARLGLVTGRGLGTLIRAHFSRRVLVACVTLVAVANTFNIAADLAAMGASAALVVSLPAAVLTVALAVVMLVLELFVSYHRYARILRHLALSLGAYLIVLLMVNVDWGAVLTGVASPGIGTGRGEIAALIAVFGTTVSPYLFFWQSSEEVEEQAEPGRPEAGRPVTRDHLTAMRIDVIGGMVSAIMIAFAIMVTTSATLHAQGITNIATADQAATALEPLAGNLAGLVFAVGIVGLGLLAVPVLAGATAYAVAEARGAPEGLSRPVRDARGFYLVVAGSMLLGIVLDLAGLDPIQGLFYAAILNGLTAPPLIIVMLMLSRSSDVLGERRSGPVAIAGLALTILASVILPIVYVVR